MVVYLYRWKLKPGLEKQFEEAWEHVTKELRAKAGSWGSRLHHGEDGLYYAYAQWPSREARQSANFNDDRIVTARRLMKDAIETSLPKVAMDIVSDFLLSRANRASTVIGREGLPISITAMACSSFENANWEHIMYHGSCLCGAVTFHVNGTFNGFFLCHCSRCRKVTGSAHAANLFSKDAGMEWVTGRDHVRQYRLPGARFTKSFCTSCGSALPTPLEGGRQMVPAGCLDNRVETKPDAHIFCGSRANWDNGLHEIPRCDEFPLK